MILPGSCRTTHSYSSNSRPLTASMWSRPIAAQLHTHALPSLVHSQNVRDLVGCPQGLTHYSFAFACPQIAEVDRITGLTSVSEGEEEPTKRELPLAEERIHVVSDQPGLDRSTSGLNSSASPLNASAHDAAGAHIPPRAESLHALYPMTHTTDFGVPDGLELPGRTLSLNLEDTKPRRWCCIIV